MALQGAGWRHTLLLISLLSAALATAQDFSRYRPQGRVQSPLLWWVLDTRPAADAAAAPELADLITTLSAWLQQPDAGARAYPPEGIRLGLLAVTPDAAGQADARILHPPVALAQRQRWPARTLHRQVALSTGFRLSTASGEPLAWGQPWSLTADQMLVASLPVMSWQAGIVLQQARLDLPLAVTPEQWPAARVNLRLLSATCALQADCAASVSPAWQGELPLVAAGSGRAGLDLALPLAALVGSQWPEASVLLVQLQPLPADAAAQGVWMTPSAVAPAGWALSWQELAGEATGASRLRHVLAGLLAVPGARLPSATSRLMAASEQLATARRPDLPAETDIDLADWQLPGCGVSSALLLGLQQPDEAAQGLRWQAGMVDAGVTRAHDQPQQLSLHTLPAALSRWRDQALRPPVQIATLQTRWLRGRLLGIDASVLQPVPGREAWPANHHFLPCRDPGACASELAAFSAAGIPALTGGLRGELARQASVLPWWSDDGVMPGAPLQDWRGQLNEAVYRDSLLLKLAQPLTTSTRSWLQAWLADELAAPQLLHGTALAIDDGPTADTASGRRSYLLWADAAGTVILQDGSSATLQWAWRTAAGASQWLRQRQDGAVPEPEPVRAEDWQVWPAASVVATMPAPWRVLYGLTDGVLTALDITQLEAPRLLFRLQLPERIGSFSLVESPDALAPPLLLMARAVRADAGPDSGDRLWLADGRSGELLWRAGVTPAGGVATALASVDQALGVSWRAGWRSLETAARSRALYSMDVGGQVWRLDMVWPSAGSAPSSLTLRRVADLAAADQASISSERFLQTPSVTWLRDDAGRRRPALALASQSDAGASGAAVYALLDQGQLLQRADLAEWQPASPNPPQHVSGWRRPWSHAGERLAVPPRWLGGQVLTSSEVPLPADCGPLRWQAWLHRLPWQQGGGTSPGSVSTDGVLLPSEGETQAVEEGVGSLSAPVLTGDGRVHWLDHPENIMSAALPATGRWLIGKQRLPPAG